MKMTIVTGAFFPVPPGVGGAVERRWFGVAKELASRGHEVTMLGRNARGIQPEAEVEGVRILRHTAYSQTGRLPLDLAKDLLYALRIRGRLPTSEVIISNDFFFPIVRPPRNGELFLVNIARVPKGQMRLYSAAHGFLVPSRAMFNSLVQEGVSRERITILPNPIDTNVFTPQEARQYNSPLKLLFAGRIHPEKGLSILVQAIRLLVAQGIELEARIIGPYEKDQGGGGASYRDELCQSARELPIAFLEPIFERPRLAEQYQWADLFVYPSIAEKGESFGVAPVEAMGTGAIPVVSALECFDEFMDEGCGERFNHRLAEPDVALSDAILRAMEGDLAQRSLVASQIARRFSYPAVADKLLETVALSMGE